MFPARYFCARYFAARYWPKVGSGAGAVFYVLLTSGDVYPSPGPRVALEEGEVYST